MQPSSGSKLLHYRLDDQLGEGGMGVVWKASDTCLDRDIVEFVSGEDLQCRLQRGALGVLETPQR